MLDVPEFVGVGLYIICGCIGTIDFQHCQARLLGCTRGCITNSTSGLLYVFDNCTRAVCGQVRGSTDCLNCAKDKFLEGCTRTRARWTADYDDWETRTTHLAPVCRFARVDTLKLICGQARDTGYFAVNNQVENDDCNLVINQIFLTGLRIYVGVTNINTAIFRA